MSIKDAKNKNIRLSHSVWTKLRMLKFQEATKTYAELFENIFEKVEVDGHRKMAEEVANSLPKPSEKQKEQESDKTIVVSADVHRKLASYKIISLTSTGATSRGPGSVSLSDIVINLIGRYQLSQNDETTS